MLDVRLPDPKPEATSLDVLARIGTAQLDAMGIDWRPIASVHNLELGGEPTEGARIVTRTEHAFLADAAQAARDPLFFWRLGDMNIEDFGLLGYATLNAPTVRDALDTLGTLMPTVCEANSYRVVVDGDEASLVYVSSDERQNSVFTLHISLNLLRHLIGPHFSPLHVGLAITEREHLNVVARQIAAPVSADSPLTFVRFPARHLSAPVMGADERLAETLRPYWQRQAASVRSRPPVLRARLESAVIQGLHLGVPTLDRLAENLKVSRSTLADDLASVGGARALVDGVRQKLARELVQRPELTTARIAELLGFSEPGALNHAYRRWTGRTPTADRRLVTPPGTSLGPAAPL